MSINTVTTVFGKNVEEMTREELIEAVKVLGNGLNASIASALEANRTWAAIARGCAR